MPRSIIWTDTNDRHEHGVHSDVKRFRMSALWLADDLFRDDDLLFATPKSLARVAKTIIVLVHSVNPNLHPICSELFRRLRSPEGPHKPFIPTCDQSIFDQVLTPSNRSTSDQSLVPSSQLTSNQPPARFNQSSQNQPTSDKWFSDKWSSNVSNQSPPPSQPLVSSLSPLSGLSLLPSGRLSSLSWLSNQSPLSNLSPPFRRPFKQSLPPSPNSESSPPGYPLPPGYHSPPGYQSPLGYQSPPRYQSTTSLPPTSKSSNNSLSSQSPSNQSTLNRSDIQSNFPYSNRNSSYWQLEDNIVGNERGDAAFDEFCMTPTVSTEMISPVQNEPPSETLTDVNALAIYLMAADKVNRFVGNNGHPNANVRIVPSQRKHSSEDLVYPRAQRTPPTESLDGFVDEPIMAPAFKDAPPRNLYSSGGNTRYEVPERVVQMETSDSLISNPILPPLVVGQPITSPSLDLPSSRLLDSADQTWFNERRTETNSVFSRGLSYRSGRANGSVPPVLLPRQSRRGDLASTRQRLPPELNHVFGSALHLRHLERMANFPIASGQHESTDLPQTLVIEVAGGARREYVGIQSQLRSFPCCAGFAD